MSTLTRPARVMDVNLSVSVSDLNRRQVDLDNVARHSLEPRS